jgi:cytochrome b561
MNAVDISYNKVSKILHWSMAVIIILMLSGSFFIEDLGKPMIPTAFMIHKSFGLLILMMVLFRLIWNLKRGVPDLPDTLTAMEKKIAKAGHHFLYLLLFAMPLTGVFMSVASKRYPTFFNLFTVTVPGIPQTKSFAGLMNQSHKILAWVMITMVVLHIAAALVHKFVKKDGVFERMACNCEK